MALRSLGNHGPTEFNNRGANGIGAQMRLIGIGWSGYVGKSGDYGFVTIQEVISQGLQLGMFAQSTGGATIELTMQNPGMVINPDPAVQATIAWDAPITLTAKKITEIPTLFTVAKITLTADGEVYLGGR